MTEPKLTFEVIAAAITAAGDALYAPEDLRQKMLAFRERNAAVLADLRLYALAGAFAFADDFDAGEDEVAVRCAAIELLIAAAAVGLEAPAQLGHRFTAERFACAAFEVGDTALRTFAERK